MKTYLISNNKRPIIARNYRAMLGAILIISMICTLLIPVQYASQHFAISCHKSGKESTALKTGAPNHSGIPKQVLTAARPHTHAAHAPSIYLWALPLLWLSGWKRERLSFRKSISTEKQKS